MYECLSGIVYQYVCIVPLQNHVSIHAQSLMTLSANILTSGSRVLRSQQTTHAIFSGSYFSLAHTRTMAIITTTRTMAHTRTMAITMKEQGNQII